MATKIVKFSTGWCPPCKLLAPIFDKVSKLPEFKGTEFSAIDIDEVEDAAVTHNIEVIPTLVVFKDDKEVVRHSGYMKEADLISWIKENSK